MVMVHHEGGRAIQVRVGDPTDLIGAVMSREVQRSSSSIRSLMLPDDQDASGVGRMVMLLDNLMQVGPFTLAVHSHKKMLTLLLVAPVFELARDAAVFRTHACAT